MKSVKMEYNDIQHREKGAQNTVEKHCWGQEM